MMYLNIPFFAVSLLLLLRELQCVKVIFIVPKTSHKIDLPLKSSSNDVPDRSKTIDVLLKKTESNDDSDSSDEDYNLDKQAMRMSGSQESIEGELDKIVGGFEVDINWYPYHVSYGANCGGTIIAKSWVMTAGHCGKKSYIRAGSKYVGKGRYHAVQNNYIHPGWSAGQKDHPFDYDFQLVKLIKPLHFGPSIQPVKIARLQDMVIGAIITVTGWGNTLENGPFSTILRAVRVPIIPKELCQKVPFPYFKGGLTNRMFCAGFVTGQKDACQGDSGGPAVSQGRLLGMVSFGYGCATPGSYGVYSKVATVRPWIEQTTGITLD